MVNVDPTPGQALQFYRAALATARLLDQDADPRVLDADADAAWRAFGGEFPPAIRCDLVLRNWAMLYPAAFAPGPVFNLSGWHDDAPWGTGFDRPDHKTMDALFLSQRNVPATNADALDAALREWGMVTETTVAEHALTPRISPQTVVVVAGQLAVSSLARIFLHGERLVLRTQVILASADPGSRHVLGITCALLRQARLPVFVDPRRDPKESIADWVAREKRNLEVTRAELVILSPDAPANEREQAQALGAALGAAETIDLAHS